MMPISSRWVISHGVRSVQVASHCAVFVVRMRGQHFFLSEHTQYACTVDVIGHGPVTNVHVPRKMVHREYNAHFAKYAKTLRMQY